MVVGLGGVGEKFGNYEDFQLDMCTDFVLLQEVTLYVAVVS